MLDPSRFSLAEAFNSSNGKTTIGLVCSFIVTVTACITFTYSVLFKYEPAIIPSSGLIALVFGYLGIRNFVAGKVSMTNGNCDTKAI